MFARRSIRRRIDDALAVASPLALAESMDAHICSRSTGDLRGLIERSAKRMDAGERKQLELYLNLDDPDDLLGHRFSAFLRQNPRAIAALDPDAADAILVELGEIPAVHHATRRLPAHTVALVALVLVVALLPLAAQYAHQRGMLQGLTDPLAAPPAIVPFVERLSAKQPARPVKQSTPLHFAPPRVAHRAVKSHKPRYVAQHRPIRKPHHLLPRHRAVAWKFDPVNNPYFNRARWSHPYQADPSLFGQRARTIVSSYLHALVAGDLRSALHHLGMPATADTNVIAELPIVTRRTTIEIVASKPSGRFEQVSADIVTDGREYYEVFYIAHDGPAARIMDRYYIPVNHSAQVAMRSLVQNSH